MARSFLKLDTRRPLKDGTYPIKFVVGYGRNLLIPISMSVRKEEWDARSQTTTKGKRWNDTLTTIYTRLSNLVLDLREKGKFDKIDNDALRRVLLTGDVAQASMQMTFYEVCERFIKTKSTERTRELYRTTMKRIREFAGDDLYLSDIKPQWLYEFDGHLGGSVNARSIHLRNIRAVINYAIDEELTENYPFRKFKIKREVTRKRALTLEKIRQYLSLDDLWPQEEEYRDMFALIFYLIGINVADLAGLTIDSLVDGRIEYRRAKTHRLYSIKVEPEAMDIIKRYRGMQHLLVCFDRNKDYRNYMHRLNDCLQKLGPAVDKARNGVPIRKPIEPECTTYWARHSWATIAASLEIPNETIAAALGHEYGNRTTAIYIDFDMKKVDEANRKVLDLVLYGKK